MISFINSKLEGLWKTLLLLLKSYLEEILLTIHIWASLFNDKSTTIPEIFLFCDYLHPQLRHNSKELFIIEGFFVCFWSRNLKICLIFLSYNGSGRSMFRWAFGLRDCWCTVWKAIISFAVIILFSSFKYFLTKIYI